MTDIELQSLLWLSLKALFLKYHLEIPAFGKSGTYSAEKIDISETYFVTQKMSLQEPRSLS